MTAPTVDLMPVEYEQNVLGCAMFEPKACEYAFDNLRPEHFSDAFHGRAWSVILGLAKADRATDGLSVRGLLSADPDFAAMGGDSFIGNLIDAAQTWSLTSHVDTILDRSARRQIFSLTNHVQAQATDVTHGSAEGVLADLERGAADIASGGAASDHWLGAADMVLGALDRAEARNGVIQYPSGIRALDELTGGLMRGAPTWLAGRPGMGKTVGGMAYAKHTAAMGKGALFMSLEMAADPMGVRLAADLAFDRLAPIYSGQTSNITMQRIARNELEPHERVRLREAAEATRSWPLKFDTRSGLTVAQIESVVRRQFRRWERMGIEPGLVVLDHLGKIVPSVNRNGSLMAEMADISNGVMSMAKRLDVPVLGLVQLNRSVEGRGEDKRPLLTDLRHAGELEQDARQVIFLYRPEYYFRAAPDGESHEDMVVREKKLRDARNKLHWIVGKNSEGPVGEALSFCEIACSAVRDWVV